MTHCDYKHTSKSYSRLLVDFITKFLVDSVRGLKKLKIPPNFTTIYWIPLGLVGQATAAAQLLGRSEPWGSIAYGFGVVTMAIGIPVVIIAASKHWPQVFRNSMAYNPTWWSCVFPLGTVVSGLNQMHNASGQVVWIGIGNVLLLLLIAHWCWAFFGGVWHVQRRRG